MMNLPALAGLPLDTPQLLAVAAALGWASGLRLYAVLFLTGIAGYMGWVPLPSGLHALQSPVMLVASAAKDCSTVCVHSIPRISDSCCDSVGRW